MIKTLKGSVSTICKQTHWDLPEYAACCSEMEQTPAFERKQWEFVFILNELKRHGKLRKGSKGLGFGCGQEPLGQVFTKYLAEVVLTDAPLSGDWGNTGEHSGSLESCFKSDKITSKEHFFRYASHRAVDMNQIPPDLRKEQFDFLWSSCALEHLGTLKSGLDFVKNAMMCLKRGGIAIHTTEYNLTSNTETVSAGDYVLYRQQDIEGLVADLKAQSFTVAPLDLSRGSMPLDLKADPIAARNPNRHVVVNNGQFEFTSLGLVIIK